MTTVGRPRSAPPSPLGERLLSRIRESHHRTVGGFAEAAGIGRRQLSRYVSGAASPRLEQLDAWAELLGVSRSWLATGDDRPALEGEGTLSTFRSSSGEGREELYSFGRPVSELVESIVEQRFLRAEVDPDDAFALAEAILNPAARELAQACIDTRDSDPERCAQLGLGLALKLENAMFVEPSRTRTKKG